MKAWTTFSFLALLFLSACTAYDLTKLPASEVNEIYQNSLEDAVYPTAGKVDNELFAINEDNTALTWKTINDEEYVLSHGKEKPNGTSHRILERMESTIPARHIRSG